MADWFRILRPIHWVKNLLVFVPLLTSHQYTDTTNLVSALFCFLAFSIIASAGYVLNDVLDLPHDQQHTEKKNRPLPAGQISIRACRFLIAGLFLAGIGLAAYWSAMLSVVVAAYFIVTSAYSIWLKKIPVVDVMVLAGLYTMRLFAGAIAIDVELSFWLIGFSMFLFLSLAYLKRFIDLEKHGEPSLAGRSYKLVDKSMIQIGGITSGFLAALVFALYINHDSIKSFYAEPRYLWLSCLIIVFWINRIWLLANRGEMHTDPIIFAVGDKASFVCALLIACSFWLAI